MMAKLQLLVNGDGRVWIYSSSTSTGHSF